MRWSIDTPADAPDLSETSRQSGPRDGPARLDRGGHGAAPRSIVACFATPFRRSPADRRRRRTVEDGRRTALLPFTFRSATDRLLNSLEIRRSTQTISARASRGCHRAGIAAEGAPPRFRVSRRRLRRSERVAIDAMFSTIGLARLDGNGRNPPIRAADRLQGPSLSRRALQSSAHLTSSDLETKAARHRRRTSSVSNRLSRRRAKWFEAVEKTFGEGNRSVQA